MLKLIQNAFELEAMDKKYELIIAGIEQAACNKVQRCWGHILTCKEV